MMAAIPPDLPINDALPDLLAALSGHTCAVLVAPPGTGKTTSVPLALLDAPWLMGRKIVMLSPRRLAARTAAARMASLLGQAVGQTIGYRVRLDSQIGPSTRVEVVTEGVFTRMILDDPELAGIGAVIFDEVHERNLEGDLALALALDVQGSLRDDLRLLAMSATLDGARISQLMNGAPLVESQGRMFPVETNYVGNNPSQSLEIQAANTALKAIHDGPGDVLIFLPGVGEINRALAHLTEKQNSKVIVRALHGGLDPREQDEALAPAPSGRRKIILSTAIAETSLTVPGVAIVVDCGQSRRAAYEPDTGLTRLVTMRASRASADQRRGRAGRTAPGLCYRLWEEAQTGAFPAFDRPEILEADMAPLVLTLAAWGVTDPDRLRWLDPPPKPAWIEAVSLLRNLHALDENGRITPHGHALSAFGLPPRLAHMIVEGAKRGFGMTAAYVAAVLSERGLGGMSVDLSVRVANLSSDRSLRGNKARGQAQGWARQMGATEALAPERAGLALALAFPDRVAKARDRRGGFVLVNGGGGEMPLEEALASSPFLAIGAVQDRAGKARIAEAASLSRSDLDDLFADDITQVLTTTYDKTSATVRGRTQTRLGALVLEEATIKLSQNQIAEGLFEAVLANGLSVLNWSQSANQLRGRLAWLHAKSPEDWPDVGNAALTANLDMWLAPYLARISSLRDLDVTPALMSLLDWPQSQRLNTEAPARFNTPVGTTHPIDYAPEQGPSVAVRVQELFGLTTHPMLAGGKVGLVFQLLSPAHRPVAVTSNLPAFWAGAWADVRKDMKARYPRHVWPENPADAAPTTRAKPRGT